LYNEYALVNRIHLCLFKNPLHLNESRDDFWRLKMFLWSKTYMLSTANYLCHFHIISYILQLWFCGLSEKEMRTSKFVRVHLHSIRLFCHCVIGKWTNLFASAALVAFPLFKKLRDNRKTNNNKFIQNIVDCCFEINICESSIIQLDFICNFVTSVKCLGR